MYTQFLGNYLLNKGYVTPEQFIDALEYQQSVHLKLGVIAIHAGFLTANEVEQIHIMQTHQTKKFGELAIEHGFMTQEQLTHLLRSQKPDYLLLSQALVDKGYITASQFEQAMLEYQSEYKLTELDFADEQHDKLVEMVQNFYPIKVIQDSSLYAQYITILFHNITRFIGKDFIPHQVSNITSYRTSNCICQKITGEFSPKTAVDMDEKSMIAFASRYAGEEFTDNNEYVQASIEDFMNLNNGLYIVNLSNEFSLELSLEPPVFIYSDTLEATKEFFQLPITFPFGTVNFMIEKMG